MADKALQYWNELDDTSQANLQSLCFNSLRPTMEGPPRVVTQVENHVASLERVMGKSTDCYCGENKMTEMVELKRCGCQVHRACLRAWWFYNLESTHVRCPMCGKSARAQVEGKKKAEPKAA